MPHNLIDSFIHGVKARSERKCVPSSPRNVPDLCDSIHDKNLQINRTKKAFLLGFGLLQKICIIYVYHTFMVCSAR